MKIKYTEYIKENQTDIDAEAKKIFSSVAKHILKFLKDIYGDCKFDRSDSDEKDKCYIFENFFVDIVLEHVYDFILERYDYLIEIHIQSTEKINFSGILEYLLSLDKHFSLGNYIGNDCLILNIKHRTIEYGVDVSDWILPEDNSGIKNIFKANKKDFEFFETKNKFGL